MSPKHTHTHTHVQMQHFAAHTHRSSGDWNTWGICSGEQTNSFMQDGKIHDVSFVSEAQKVRVSVKVQLCFWPKLKRRKRIPSSQVKYQSFILSGPAEKSVIDEGLIIFDLASCWVLLLTLEINQQTPEQLEVNIWAVLIRMLMSRTPSLRK